MCFSAGPEGVAVDAVVADDEWDAETGLGVHGFDGARPNAMMREVKADILHGEM